MRKRAILLTVLGLLLSGDATASWYWPDAWKPTGWFGSDEKKDEPRMSELMEPASLAIDDATDLINDGKTDKAVEKYREALRLLERLEAEHPERAATPEFQSVRNKRAYVNAQLNAILLEEARLNAKAVAVTDTTGLEEKLREKRRDASKRKKDEKKAGTASDATPKLESELDRYMDDERMRAKKVGRAAATARFERENEEKIAELLKEDPESRKARIMRAGLEIYRKNYGSARKDISDLLAKNPDDVSALNLLAAVDVATGDYESAERALEKAIRANGRDYHAYYNLAKLVYKKSNGKDMRRVKAFYRAGRAETDEDGEPGPRGPVDPFLEKVLE